VLHHVALLAAQGAGSADMTQMEDSVTSLFGNLLTIGTAVGVAVCAFFLMFAGYLWMSAGGNVRQMESAKQALFNALAGLAIILTAAFLANAVQAAINTKLTS
jgi:hypothetical protein